MRKTYMFFAVILVYLLTVIVSVYAEEAGSTELPEEQVQPKDECMLFAVRCGNSIVSIQDKIERLKGEIKKGKTVYNPEEINILKHKLEEASRVLDYLLDKQ